MKVYKTEYIGGYGGGVCVIAAKTKEEAIKMLVDRYKHTYVLDSDMSDMEEIEGLIYNGESEILIDAVYCE